MRYVKTLLDLTERIQRFVRRDDGESDVGTIIVIAMMFAVGLAALWMGLKFG